MRHQNEVKIHRGEWRVLGVCVLVMSILIAFILHFLMDDKAPIFTVLCAGILLMMFCFMRSAKRRTCVFPR